MALSAVSQRLSAKSAAMLSSIEGSLDRIMLGWLLLAATASAARIALSPIQGPIGPPVCCPTFCSFLLRSSRWRWRFAGSRTADTQAQPSIRLARIGRWRDVSRSEARTHPLFGAGGYHGLAARRHADQRAIPRA
jgi:hypothetical protein